MRKLIYIFPLFFTVLFTACEVESGESGYPTTLQAKVIYDAVENRLFQSVSILDLMTKIDYYGQVPVDEKEGVKNYFLSRYTITQTDKSWTLKAGDEEIVFTHNRKSINEEGAIWTVKVTIKLWDGKTANLIEDKNFRVESLGDKDWRVITTGLKFYSPLSGYTYPTDNLSDSDLSIKGTKSYDKSPNLYDFKMVNGTGNLPGSPMVSYKLSQPISYAYSNSFYRFLMPISGELSITADKDEIGATIVGDSYYPQVKITCSGITEYY